MFLSAVCHPAIGSHTQTCIITCMHMSYSYTYFDHLWHLQMCGSWPLLNRTAEMPDLWMILVAFYREPPVSWTFSCKSPIDILPLTDPDLNLLAHGAPTLLPTACQSLSHLPLNLRNSLDNDDLEGVFFLKKKTAKWQCLSKLIVIHDGSVGQFSEHPQQGP